MFKKHFLVAFAVLALALGACGGGSGSSSTDGDQETTFSAGGVTLTTSISGTATSKTVTVTNEDGDTVLTLVLTTTGATLSAPGQTDASMTFRTPLDELPTDYTARRMAVFAAGPMATASISVGSSIRPDSPGCDWFDDTQCTLGCCADHDLCYALNGCGASSWLWGFGSDACDNCNDVVYDCIAAACLGVTESFLEDNCYDGRCNLHYDCPPDYDVCDCQDICADSGITVPSTCGNGDCETGETLDNCFTDCAFGTSQSACCVANNDCPSETPTTCPGSCCCCGVGYTCNPATHRCEYGDF